MKIVFFGTSNVALPVLEALKKQHEIAAVVTTPDSVVGRKQELSESPVSALAKDLQLLTFKPESLKDNKEFLNKLQNLSADVFVVVAYGKILPEEIINLPKLKTLNVHPSLLPKYRGPSPIKHALLDGQTQTGTSIMLIDSGMDTGPVLAQDTLQIEPDDNDFTLTDKLSKLSANLLLKTISEYAEGAIQPKSQDEADATYSKMVSKGDGKLDWQKTSREIYNQFRAFFLWPGIWTTWNGNVLKIANCAPLDYPIPPNTAPGSVLEQGVVVCGSNTALQISRLQLAGKNEIGILEFLNGYKEFTGSKLE
jgi:methionyl-tRNA formyltransferase